MDFFQFLELSLSRSGTNKRCPSDNIPEGLIRKFPSWFYEVHDFEGSPAHLACAVPTGKHTLGQHICHGDTGESACGSDYYICPFPNSENYHLKPIQTHIFKEIIISMLLSQSLCLIFSKRSSLIGNNQIKQMVIESNV